MTDVQNCCKYCGNEVHLEEGCEFEEDSIYCHTCHIEFLEESLESASSEIKNQEQDLAIANNKAIRLEADVENRTNAMQALSELCNSRGYKIMEMNDLIVDLEAKIKRLEENVDEFEGAGMEE